MLNWPINLPGTLVTWHVYKVSTCDARHAIGISFSGCCYLLYTITSVNDLVCPRFIAKHFFGNMSLNVFVRMRALQDDHLTLIVYPAIFNRQHSRFKSAVNVVVFSGGILLIFARDAKAEGGIVLSFQDRFCVSHIQRQQWKFCLSSQSSIAESLVLMPRISSI